MKFTPAVSAPPPPAPQQPAPPPSNVIVYITDSTFVGPHVNIPVDGSVTWVNLGSTVHTASAIGPVRLFDTGGLIHGQAVTKTLTTPGVYAYTSAPDCLGGNTSRFSCGDSFTVTVTN